ncbi:PREDICTED: G-type lectin S-receptor [Prunus dulcis]|uniref:non-specific serine/threonine protein kinase n=1 Tax=Prunus dulcis TaxID=3755 RepID=A0A5E4G811_PRUDU|nr:PREDICTED: G-type lectin S-receptor [Prunus dulcis]
MTRTNCTITWFTLLLLLCSAHPFCFARDTLTYDTPITDGIRSETLVSAGGEFELGFFTPSSTQSSGLARRYVGIWYHNISPRTVVWVANREKPVVNSTSTGVFAIKEGNLQVLDSFTDESYWSTELQTPKSSNLVVRLMDSGNLVLFKDGDDHLWQSFQNATDTFIPGMVMDTNLELTSWRNQDDPGIGNFTFKLDQEGDNHFVISRKLIPYWKSGKPGEFSTSAEMIPPIARMFLNFSKSAAIPIGRGYNYYTFTAMTTLKIKYKRTVMNFNGKIQFLNWLEQEKRWSLLWTLEPRDRCSVFNACGNFGSCNSNNWPLVCKCLPGFKPQFAEQWETGDFSGGCERKSTICSEDTFLRLKMMKVGKPDTHIDVDNETGCRNECLNNCQCQAFSYSTGVNSTRRDYTPTSLCWIWLRDLNNLEEEYGHCGEDLSVRVALESEEQSRRKMSLSLILIVVAVLRVVIFLACIVCVYIWRRKTTKRRDKINRAQLDSERRVQELMDTTEFTEEDERDIDVPFFDLQSILDATDNFSNANKLGQGGYGPVYKGKLPGGQEIAVKRLSSCSGQGLEEFKNEVLLIAKLQHRNLVRLLGYCVEGDEKMLVYEYMANKSLDSFIFDRRLCMLLNWDMRFNVILGIARGLLYLHQDSRLRIIHRDLKTSNILLGEDMNPKISDFGLARIFGGNETAANTSRVVGTYGYMAPEYALDGLFSVKSDVFSFGVVVIEIISGKRNTGFFQPERSLSLLGYAWHSWKEEKALDLLDQTLCQSCNKDEYLKCVNVGLLCVQEDPSDRPTMSQVVFMLGSETATIPAPKQPAFIVRRCPSRSSRASSSSKPETFSNNELTITLEDGFFSPENSTKYFLGIWYNKIPKTPIVWVANRESPLDSPGVFTLSGDGNVVVLEIMDRTRKVIWSSNISIPASAMKATTGVLMDNGNLELRLGEDTLWQSFDHPFDTFLPGMKLSLNTRTGQQRVPGQTFFWKENAPYWRSDLYIGKQKNTAFDVGGENAPSSNGTAYFLPYNFDADEVYLTYGVSDSSTKLRVILNPTGQIKLLLWLEHSETWFVRWREPFDQRDFYPRCGPCGACRG